ncbi:glycosyl hydrolase [Isoptericola sp. BMS4]|uniref:glycosyl hydrolase n=1 Tax=Isoptericola sp. BMS4 TaxID=2527875 RepID=UPI001422CA3B|nr:glycosyl hydrolase [Isoptericola sp. BMS4]
MTPQPSRRPRTTRSSPPRPAPQRRAGRLAAAALAATLATAGLVAVAAPPAAADTVPVGSGSYTTDSVGSTPQGCDALAADPRAFLTADAPDEPLPTNDWWTSLAYKKFDCAFSAPLHAHPASYLPDGEGLGMGYTTTAAISGDGSGVSEYHYPYGEDVHAGVVGLTAPDVKVADWSDWTVTAAWDDGTRSLRATVGHGLPLAWFDAAGGDAELTTTAPAQVWLDDGARLGLRVGDADYLAVAPAGSTWSGSGTRWTAPLGADGGFALAVLPDTDTAGRDALAAAYTDAARAPVTDTRVDYVYDEAAGEVRTTYAFTTEPRPGAADAGTVAALYPHQSAYLSSADPAGPTYTSARGDMAVLAGVDSFTTATPFHGVLTELPAVATSSGTDGAMLETYLDEVAGDPLGRQGPDTYWTGKALGRATRIVEIADQLGRTGQRDAALAAVRDVLTDWFTAEPGETEGIFAYDDGWDTLIGYPASYGADTELNDHHFHYGYFVAAAATLARFDPGWADEYGGMVDLLIRDANGYDRTDTRFPYLRDFDVYAGHDWASGHGAFGAGNNQESSSEGMNFAGALVQWGEATGDTEVRDAGAFIYATQAAAIQRYWFDAEDSTFPDGFAHPTVGMVWGDGGAYSTWFSAEPEMIQGINALPVTGSHLYLGHSPATVREMYAHLEQVNGGPPTVWQDVLWSRLALGDADGALSRLRAAGAYTPEEGESRAHTFHWVRNLAALGEVDTSVRADHPLAAVFTDDGARTYVASNVTSSDLDVTFSDGTTLTVPAGQVATTGAHTWNGGSAPGGGPGDGGGDPGDGDGGDPGTCTDPGDAGPALHVRGDGTLAADAGPAGTVRLASAGGANHDGTPHEPAVFTATGVTASYDGGATAFALPVDAGTTVGLGVQARVSYDLTGDGSWDRTETYAYFATDPVPGAETYAAAGRLADASGSLGDLACGTVRLEVWSAIGDGEPVLTTGPDATLTLPATG